MGEEAEAEEEEEEVCSPRRPSPRWLPWQRGAAGGSDSPQVREGPAAAADWTRPHLREESDRQRSVNYTCCEECGFMDGR